jgi:hypothetical protein
MSSVQLQRLPTQQYQMHIENHAGISYASIKTDKQTNPASSNQNVIYQKINGKTKKYA